MVAVLAGRPGPSVGRGAAGGPVGVLNAAGRVPREAGWEFTGTGGPAGPAPPRPAGRYGLTAARHLPPPCDLRSPGRGQQRGVGNDSTDRSWWMTGVSRLLGPTGPAAPGPSGVTGCIGPGVPSGPGARRTPGPRGPADPAAAHPGDPGPRPSAGSCEQTSVRHAVLLEGHTRGAEHTDM